MKKKNLVVHALGIVGVEIHDALELVQIAFLLSLFFLVLLSMLLLQVALAVLATLLQAILEGLCRVCG